MIVDEIRICVFSVKRKVDFSLKITLHFSFMKKYLYSSFHINLETTFYVFREYLKMNKSRFFSTILNYFKNAYFISKQLQFFFIQNDVC